MLMQLCSAQDFARRNWRDFGHDEYACWRSTRWRCLNMIWGSSNSKDFWHADLTGCQRHSHFTKIHTTYCNCKNLVKADLKLTVSWKIEVLVYAVEVSFSGFCLLVLRRSDPARVHQKRFDLFIAPKRSLRTHAKAQAHAHACTQTRTCTHMHTHTYRVPTTPTMFRRHCQSGIISGVADCARASNEMTYPTFLSN